MEPVLTLTVVAVASLAFGLVRQWVGRPIGFGVFVAVAVGSCALAIAAVRTDADSPLPLVGGAVTGIAFLGVGALIKSDDRIHGFSTAGTIWALCVFGVTAGLDQRQVAWTVYATVWVVVGIDRLLLVTGTGPYRRVLSVAVKGVESDAEATRRDLLGERRASLLGLQVDRAGDRSRLVWRLEGSAASVLELERRLRADARVLSFELDA